MGCKKHEKDPKPHNMTSLVTESDGAVFSITTSVWFCKVCDAPVDSKSKATQLSKGS